MAQALLRRSRHLAALAVAAVAMLGMATSAQANWWYTKHGAEKLTRDLVSRYYTNMRYEDLSASCRVKGGRYDPHYKYHAWVCVWVNHRDRSYGQIRITGSDSGPGAYHYKILNGVRYLP
jgi:hypothetical protein